MTAIATFADALERMATKGFYVPRTDLGQASTTAPSSLVNGGAFSVYHAFDAYRTTLWSTLVGGPVPSGPDAPTLLANVSAVFNNNRGMVFGWLYKIGDLNLAATGDQFTHDAATFPVLRTKMGQASQPYSLIPILFVSTATTTTLAVITLKNGAATTGYVDQDGNTVVGVKTFGMPNAVTAISSGFVLPLEDVDTAIRDIQAINVGTAATAGAAQIYGFEPLVALNNSASGVQSPFVDLLGEMLAPLDMRPAVATSGTVTAYFGAIALSVAGQSNVPGSAYMGFKNS